MTADTFLFVQFAVALVLVPIMVGGLGLTWMALRGRQRIRELAYQERIAMIEKGLMPSPESNPAGFDAMLAPRRPSPKAVFFRTAGVVLTGLGLALTVLLFFVVPDIRGVALGVGGALTVIGMTVLANALLLAGDGGESNPRNSAPRG